MTIRSKALITVVMLVGLSAAATVKADTIAPLGLTNRALGGGPITNGAPNEADLKVYAWGVEGGTGLNNVGLLVRTWGTVTYVEYGSEFFYIDDGSNINDNMMGGIGIRVYYGGLAAGNEITPPTEGQIVAVTGISCLAGDTGYYVRQLRPRRQDDITLLRDVIVP